jgi:predicted  nucleic acid-binding Zn-ribbon protein
MENPMRTTLIRIALALSVAGFATAALAASAEDFNAAYAKAEAANKQAGALKNQWTTTASELKAAKKAADAGKFDDAVKLAEQAEALANASIAQAKEQETAWTQAVVR